MEEGSDTEVDVEAAAPLKDPRSDAWNLTETFLAFKRKGWSSNHPVWGPNMLVSGWVKVMG